VSVPNADRFLTVLIYQDPDELKRILRHLIKNGRSHRDSIPIASTDMFLRSAFGRRVSVPHCRSVPNSPDLSGSCVWRSRVTDKYAASPLRTAIFAVIRANSLAVDSFFPLRPENSSSYYSTIALESFHRNPKPPCRCRECDRDCPFRALPGPGHPESG
jgi:hypothetical protein